MTRFPSILSLLRPALSLAVLAPLGTSAFGMLQEGDAAPAVQPEGQYVPGTTVDEGASREEMWAAPTAEDWARPCLITWQRTWEDAVEVSRETNKAILVCVNMDGEIASEHYAGIRYRQPEAAILYKPYVTVIASVYRHNPRDYDERGQRILCPRFGSVTCGEHIWIEPLLYEKFLDGRRIAPRHIMVELDGKETYDVFYAFDTKSVFQSISDGITTRKIEPFPDTRGDRTLVERVDSHDVEDRIAIERAYAQGDRELRRRLVEAAIQYKDVSQIDLLRLAVFGLDVDLARLAREALAQATDESAIELIAEALRVPLEAPERDALIAALDRLGETFPRARSLAVVHRGLASGGGAVDAEGWSKALEDGSVYAPTTDWVALESRVDYRAELSAAQPEDPLVHLELAEAALELAVDPETAQALAADRRTQATYSRLTFEDAQRAAAKAEELGAKGWRVDATLGLCAYYLGDLETAYERAETAVADLPAGAEGWNALAVVALFAEARQKAIEHAVANKTEWPADWLSDVNSAYSVIARHPLGTESHVVAHHDFLRKMRADGAAARVLDEGLARFPDSWDLHGRLRRRILDEGGVKALEPAYEARLSALDASPNLPWFAGYASIVAAEFHRRWGNEPGALAAYERAIAHYDRAIETNPDSRDSADHYAAVALAGRARVVAQAGDDDAALELLLASFTRRPEAAASLDGLNLSAVTTAQMLLARFESREQSDQVARLEAALDQLDPEMLRLPEFELEGPSDSNLGGGPRWRRGPRRDR